MPLSTTVQRAAPERAPAPVPEGRKTVLVSVTGQSPAVLTETIWALAQEKPPIIPHRVVVITTSEGRKALVRDLLEPADGCVWDQLREALQSQGHDLTDRLKFGQTREDIRVFTMFDPATKRSIELADITNEPQNLAAADFIMEQVRGLADDGVRLVGSVAGGRKTMGALLFAVMSLLGRRNDLLTHVLINEPFDSPGLKPRFYFPVTPVITHLLTDRDGNPVKDREGKPITKRTDEARIQLGRIPFVALRTLFERDVRESPSYSALVQRCQQSSDELARRTIQFTIHRLKRVLFVNGKKVAPSAKEHVFLLVLAERALQMQPEVGDYTEAFDIILARAEQISQDAISENIFGWRKGLGKAVKDDAYDGQRFCTRQRNSLKEKLKKAGPEVFALDQFLPEKGRFSLDLPPTQITIVD